MYKNYVLIQYMCGRTISVCDRKVDLYDKLEKYITLTSKVKCSESRNFVKTTQI